MITLKEEEKELKDEKKSLYAEQDALNVNKKDEVDLSNEEKEFHHYSGKATSSYLFEEMLKTWLERNHKKFKKLNTNVQT